VAILLKAMGSLVFTLLVLLVTVRVFVWLVITDLSQFVSRMMNWIKNGYNYWLVLIPFLISIVSVIILHNYKWGLDLFRLIGIIIEVLGLLTVVWSLSRESQKYDHVGFHRSFINWACEAVYIFKPRSGVFEVAGLTCSASIGGSALIAANLNFNSIDEKVEYLLRRVTELQTSVDNNRKLIQENKNELSAKIQEVSTTLGQEIGMVKNELREKATLDYYLLISGAWLTVLGMVITNVPDTYFQLIFGFPVK
jgi:hypothetical protein